MPKAAIARSNAPARRSRTNAFSGQPTRELALLRLRAEAGSHTALVKQAEVAVADGELNLRFTASEGEPIVAAIEILVRSS